ncbi:hypothetical protein GNX18_00070 [Microbulbifer sp. SH-1]|uniref:type II toxin-antitoxin system RelE/ParE family toxin n=1 Tax=Microbulbifer sp. SH-1 TaxID=2681547 RepID=UPI00140D7C24|nr:type II toxin-antitoxin system RelE/ParE family toxin [Microbulbifer sp. SH-1]QIL88345.1 hypothetical protein GNX18_00070 [Microbulbifer sp. SH-1]
MILQYSPESIADLTRLREFIAEKNPIAAQRIAGELLEGIKVSAKESAPVFPDSTSTH